MKRNYEKPMMIVENFLLSDYIASCEFTITFTSGCENYGVQGDNPNVVGLLQQQMMFGAFNSAHACGLVYAEGDMIGGTICYHTSTGDVTAFTS